MIDHDQNAMATEDRSLENYLKKLMELQYNPATEQQFTEEELKNIALEAGLTQEAWQKSQHQARQHLQRGRAYLGTHNYDDAAEELEQAAALRPHDAEANFLAAQAFLHRGSRHQRSADFDKSAYYLDRTISINAHHSGALRLKGELNDKRRVHNNEVAEKTRTNTLTKWGIIGGVAVLLIAGLYSMYNSMVGLEEHVNSSWAQVENQYERRAELIPNLIATVEGAANFERETLNEITEARAQATSVQVDPDELDAASLAEFSEKQAALSGSLSRLLAVAEDYPTLTATGNFRDLQSQLEGTENRIAVERRRFNEAVQNYNARARRFPYNLLGFDTKAYFSSDPENATAPKVEF